MKILAVVTARAAARVQAWRALATPESPTRFSGSLIVLLALSLALVNAVAVVQALNLYHTLAVNVSVDRASALRHGAQIFALERSLHIAVEPAVQRAVAHGLWTPLGVLLGPLLRGALTWVYLHAFPAWLFAGLAWAYVYKQQRFAVLRDLTIISSLLAVLCYRLFPAAPPRFVLAHPPYSMRDWTYGGTSIDPHLVHVVGFNPYAAFPSVHFLWAIIPAFCIAWGSRSTWVWLAALSFPILMVVTVISTGNHYVLDSVGSLSILAGSAVAACGINRVRRRMVRARRQARYELPGALCLCLFCAGILADVGVGGGVRVLLAAEILLMVAFATGRSPYLWQGRRRLDSGRQPLWRSDYLTGLFFIAGASGAALAPGHQPSIAVRFCAVLWFLACMSALARHVHGPAACRASVHGRRALRRYLPAVQSYRDASDDRAA